MGNIYVEFKINEPSSDPEAQETKIKRVRELLENRLHSRHQQHPESLTPIRYECDRFDGRERWKIYVDGDGSLELFATSIRNDVADILSGADTLLVHVAETGVA